MFTIIHTRHGNDHELFIDPGLENELGKEGEKCLPEAHSRPRRYAHRRPPAQETPGPVLTNA